MSAIRTCALVFRSTGLAAAAFAVIAAVVLALVTSPARPVFACTPPPGGLPIKTVADRVGAADIALKGTVIAFTGEEFMGNQVATIRVEQYYKGEGPALVTVSRYGTGSLCLTPVTVGREGLFYILDTPDGLRASYLTQFDAIGNADAETLALAVEATGHPPTEPDPRTIAIGAGVARGENNPALAMSDETGSIADGSSPRSIVAGGFAVALLASMGVVVVRGRGHRPG